MRLAVNRLNTCHTHADVERALQQLPLGMEALYDRMASSIAHNPSTTDRALASTILRCVTCSLRVLKIRELPQALHEVTFKMLDLQRSIVDLCGGFVVIDNGGNVAIIHQTAREYLLGSNSRPFHIDPYAAHEQMFLSCMECLMGTGLRAKISRNQGPELLDYAATWWSSHLLSTSIGSERVLKALRKFLKGYWVLTWIQHLAMTQQLRILVQTSKNLSKFSSKLKVREATPIETENQVMEHELFEGWATDFIKLVGKFGSNLRRNPEAIYKAIPPFCPRKSSIYQSFGKAETTSLTISGLSTECWDDSLARISLEAGAYASSVSAAGAHVALLAMSGNSSGVFVYDSSTFELAAMSPINHGERVYRMVLNTKGTLLATYGYRTTKVWEISTGKCMLSVANIESRPRPLTMLFVDNNTTLLVGTDDRRVRSLHLADSSSSWKLVAELDEPELEGHFLNSSSHMSLSKDGSLIIVAYRGHPLSAWEMDGPVHIGHCWRNREEISRGEVIEAVWHPHSPEVLGLYIEGVAFKWRPYDDEATEIPTGASRLAMSRDGNLFATGDVHGTVKVFTTADLCLLYQLTSQDTVLGLAFGPDPYRFYDIRGYYGNVWEPSDLIRFAEQASQGLDDGSETESISRSSIMSMSYSTRIDSITVLAASPTGCLYCYGTEKGTVQLYDKQRGRIADVHISKSYMSIEKMCWSGDGELLCFSDSSKKIFVVSVATNSDMSEPLIATKAQITAASSTKGPVLQLLFSPDCSRLLVHTTSAIHAISLSSYTLTHSSESQATRCEWIIHPLNQAFLVGFAPDACHVIDWDLTERHRFVLDYPGRQSTLSRRESSQWQDTVDRVLVAHDKKHVLVQMSQIRQKSRDRMLLYFQTSSLSTTASDTADANCDHGSSRIAPVVLPQSLSSQVVFLLSFFTHNRLVFLSKAFSVCSWQLSVATGSPSASRSLLTTRPHISLSQSTRHSEDQRFQSVDRSPDKKQKELFSLPADWISRDCLALCIFWGVEKSFLCPKNGELAIVKCAMPI